MIIVFSIITYFNYDYDNVLNNMNSNALSEIKYACVKQEVYSTGLLKDIEKNGEN